MGSYTRGNKSFNTIDGGTHLLLEIFNPHLTAIKLVDIHSWPIKAVYSFSEFRRYLAKDLYGFSFIVIRFKQ